MGSDKNVKWIPLDVDALDDPKIIALVAALGMEGYGIYIMLIQYLAKEEPDYEISLDFLKHLAYRNHVSEEKVKAVLSGFNLFEIEDNYFHSNSLLRRMAHYNNLKEINRKKAEIRWAKDKMISTKNAAALPEHYRGNASRVEKNRIEKNRVEENRIEKNSEEEVISESKDSDPSLSPLDNDILKLYEWITTKKLPNTNEPVFPERFLPKSEKQKSTWLQCIDKLVRLDKYSLQEINRAIIFAREDPFWAKNFLSLLKLRNKDKNDVKYIDRFVNEYDNHVKKIALTHEDPVDKILRETMEIINSKK
jgi:hypothetical protein